MKRKILTPSSEFSIITDSQASLMYEAMKRGDNFEITDTDGSTFSCEKYDGLKFSAVNDQPPEILAAGYVHIFMYESKLDMVTSHITIAGFGIRDFFRRSDLDQQGHRQAVEAVPYLVERAYQTLE
jgi:hypothetical protein